MDNALDEREYNMIYKIFFKDISYRQVGRDIGLSVERVRQIVKRGLNKIRIYLQKDKYKDYFNE